MMQFKDRNHYKSYPTIALLLMLLLNAFICLKGQTASFLSFSDNYRIYPSEVTQTEVFIVNSPKDDDVLFSSCNTLNFIPFFISEGIYTTLNNGETWTGNDTCTGEPIAFHGGDPGITIDKNGTFILTRLGRSPFVGLYSHYSNDNGLTWSSQQVISTDDLERASLATDAITTSNHYGTSYACWIKFAPPFPLMFASTDDGASNWSTPLQVNNPDQRSAGGDVAVGPDGEVYTCWAGVTAASPFKEILVGFASSATGGTNWEVTENAFPINGITGILEEKDNIRVNGLPAIAVDTTSGPQKGWIYIITGQKDLAPSGSDPDIILNRSTDGGKTWSAGIRVNQDELNNGKIQYFPSIHVDQYGGVNVLFYDDRNTTSDSTGVMLARSTDGGDTWMEHEISDHNYKPTPIGGLGQGYQGDNIDLTSNSTTIWPVWMDNATGIYQIWTAPVSFESLDFIGEDDPSTILLEQNYPNPFSGSTNIIYQLKESGFVSLRIYDRVGREVARLVEEVQTPGRYSVSVNSEHLTGDDAAGCFFYRIIQNDWTETKMMIRLDH
jgi:hypothetical protein